MRYQGIINNKVEILALLSLQSKIRKLENIFNYTKMRIDCTKAALRWQPRINPAIDSIMIFEIYYLHYAADIESRWGCGYFS